MEECSISVRGLQKYYGTTHAVDGISFQVNAGELFGFLGVNGAGKTTTIQMLSTLVRPTAGEAEICGHKLGREDAQIRREIGIVRQQNVLDDLLTVEENLISRASLYQNDRAENKKRLATLCELLSLEDTLKRRYRQLSGGQKRKCEIAAALMHAPKVLFLDEPTTGLDPATRKAVWHAVRLIRKQYGTTVFLTTHYMEEAAQANHILILDKGKEIASGTPFELKEQFAYDKLTLYPKDLAAFATKLQNEGTTCRVRGRGVQIAIPNTLASYDLLQRWHAELAGFEVVQGTMDDVFLNACKGSEEEAV